jgi:hypothetical protein
VECVDTRAHITGIERDEDLQAASKAQHDVRREWMS